MSKNIIIFGLFPSCENLGNSLVVWTYHNVSIHSVFVSTKRWPRDELLHCRSQRLLPSCGRKCTHSIFIPHSVLFHVPRFTRYPNCWPADATAESYNIPRVSLLRRGAELLSASLHLMCFPILTSPNHCLSAELPLIA